MKYLWWAFAIVAILSFAFFTLTYEQRQAVAKYIVMCFILAVIIRPVGLTIGDFLRKILKRD